MEELSFSKINLGLAILNKRSDGYHNIDTIFQSIMLGDSIYFAEHDKIVFNGAMPELPDYMQKVVTYDENNLAYRALEAIQKYTDCKKGAAIHLLKRVPVAAGLGGGSSDAAAMIKGLNKFWKLELTKEEMLEMAKPLGADVAFLMQAGTARGTGIGEQLKYIKSLPITWLLVVRPRIDVITAKAYQKFSETSEYNSKTIDEVEQAIISGNIKEVFAKAKNTFEELLFPEYTELQKCKEFFVKRGYQTIMSGSGPTMIVHLPTPKDAIKLQSEIKKAGHDWLVLITKTKN